MAGLDDEIRQRINQQHQQAQAEEERLRQEQIAAYQKHEAEKAAVINRLKEVGAQEELETVQRELWGGKGKISYEYGGADYRFLESVPESVQVILRHDYSDVTKIVTGDTAILRVVTIYLPIQHILLIAGGWNCE